MCGFSDNSVNIYLFKVNDSNNIKRCKKCLKSTIKTPERCQSFYSVNFEEISQISLVFLLHC